MGLKRNRFDRAAHIKRHTEGTSNEISYDVLEGKRAALDGDTKKVRKGTGILPGVRVPSLNFGLGSKVETPHLDSDRPTGLLGDGSAAGLTSDADANGKAVSDSKKKHARKPRVPKDEVHHFQTPEEAQAEVEHRKERRRRYRRRARVLIVVAVVALIAAVASTAYSYYQYEQDKGARIDALVTKLSEVDDTLVKVDEAIEDPVSAVASGEWKTLKSDLENTKASLQDCSSSARLLASKALDQDSKNLLTQIESCSTERLTMVSSALSIFSAAEDVQRALDSANTAWLVLVDADSLAREASTMLSEAVADDSFNSTVEASKTKSEQARDRFNEAAVQFAELEVEYPGVDLQVYKTYAATRSEALDHAIAADQALIDRDRATATSENAQYDELDAKAVELASSFPRSISVPIKDVFEESQKELLSVYEDARSAASASDAVIRDYLGASR